MRQQKTDEQPNANVNAQDKGESSQGCKTSKNKRRRKGRNARAGSYAANDVEKNLNSNAANDVENAANDVEKPQTVEENAGSV